MEEPAIPSYDLSGLDSRDLRIIRLAARGYNIKEIAKELKVSESLVKKRRSALLETYRVRSLLTLCVSAALQGLIT